MANQKHKGTPAELLKQKVRTYRNKAERYKVLIEMFPNDPQRSTWEKYFEFYSKRPEK